MRRSREKKVRGQITRDKRGDHSRHTDEDNRRGEQRNIPERRGVRTAQTGLGRGFGVLCPGCLHWEGKRRVVFISERNWYDGGGVENGALLIPPRSTPGTAVQYLRFPILVPDPKTFRRTQGPQKCFWRGWSKEFGFFQKKTVGWLRIKRLS